MKAILLAALVALGIVWFIRRRSSLADQSLRADRPPITKKKKKKDIIDGRPVVEALFNLATESFGSAPAPQYRFEDVANIYRENDAGRNMGEYPQVYNEKEPGYSW